TLSTARTAPKWRETCWNRTAVMGAPGCVGGDGRWSVHRGTFHGREEDAVSRSPPLRGRCPAGQRGVFPLRSARLSRFAATPLCHLSVTSPPQGGRSRGGCRTVYLNARRSRRYSRRPSGGRAR